MLRTRVRVGFKNHLRNIPTCSRVVVSDARGVFEKIKKTRIF